MNRLKEIFGMLLIVFLITSCKENTMEKMNNSQMKEMDISMFDAPKEGFERFIITLEQFENEDNYQIEIFAEKKHMVDCNSYTLSGQFEKKPLTGWGYNYYNFKTNGVIFGTRKACENQVMKEKYVSSQAYKLSYNSKLPIVVYAPKSIRISYAIWKKNSKNKVAKKQ